MLLDVFQGTVLEGKWPLATGHGAQPPRHNSPKTALEKGVHGTREVFFYTLLLFIRIHFHLQVCQAACYEFQRNFDCCGKKGLLLEMFAEFNEENPAATLFLSNQASYTGDLND